MMPTIIPYVRYFVYSVVFKYTCVHSHNPPKSRHAIYMGCISQIAQTFEVSIDLGRAPEGDYLFLLL